MRMLDGSCLYSLAPKYRQYSNYIIGNDWDYAEISFKARGQTGLSRLKKQIVRYGIMHMKLPRELPNIVFDSNQHQHRQFRMVFESKQHIQLEGNFNKYFATYFGDGYTIDDLSFITPEVMMALIDAKDYDIEIVHGSLLLFGQIWEDPVAQLDDMRYKINIIREKLLNNILTYRDERVPYKEGRKVVARAGMFLESRPISSLFVYIIIGLLYALPFIVILYFAVAVYIAINHAN